MTRRLQIRRENTLLLVAMRISYGGTILCAAGGQRQHARRASESDCRPWWLRRADAGHAGIVGGAVDFRRPV
jgi:hypothetical protein